MKKGNKKSKYPQRGSVYQVEFDPAKGSEIKKTRPAVVVSNDDMNELAKTVLVMPITGGHHAYYLRIPISPPEGGLVKQSVIVTEQIRAIDKDRIKKELGKVKPTTMKGIEEAIRLHTGLPKNSIEN